MLRGRRRVGAARYAAPMDPEPGEDVFFHGHPSWRSMFAFHLKGFLSAIAVGVIVGLISAFTDKHPQVPWIVVAVVVWMAGVILIGFIRRVRTTYTITDRRLTIDLGLLSREVHETRLERVQNVNSSQSMIERLLRVGTVDFDTAGSASSTSPSEASQTRIESRARSTGRCRLCGRPVDGL